MNATALKQRTLGILLFPNFETLDVFGPIEMFGMLPNELKIILIAEQQGLVKSVHGQYVNVDYQLETTPHLDIILVPGGMGTRIEVNNQLLLQWIKAQAQQAELTLSVCTGAALLAKAGVLDGHRATTNKISFDWVVAQGPKTNWAKKARWVDDGPVITSSGISAGIDMSLHVIARLFGESTRESIAKRAEYVPNNDPQNDTFADS
jgi:transcriptional regulator GlxA family with amidase domain